MIAASVARGARWGALLAPLLVAGCLRWGFGESDAADGSAGDGAGSAERAVDVRAATELRNAPPRDDARAHDAGASDQPRVAEDARADGPPADQTSPADSGAAEAGPAADAASGPGACSPSAPFLLAQVDATMAICGTEFVTSAYDQCSAHYMCNAAGGWTLCPAAVYRARFGGSSAPPAVETAWIAGCVRSGPQLTAPTSSTCNGCSGSPLSSASEVSWDCATAAVTASSAGRSLGLVTSLTCNRVGENVTATAGFWAVRAANAPLRRAVCCR